MLRREKGWRQRKTREVAKPVDMNTGNDTINKLHAVSEYSLLFRSFKQPQEAPVSPKHRNQVCEVSWEETVIID